ncbi:MAG: phosphoglycerate dehydrogenase [Rhodospirillales bacterium]|nr:phosphoglycerate dehydrogenase [Rhodospirillales bacterium]
MTSVAVTSRSFSRNPVLRDELLERYPNTTFNDDGLKLAGDELVAFLKGHDRAITALETLDAKVFAELPELKVLSKYGVGFDMIDLGAMTKAGVKLGWSGGTNKRSVSELVISFAVQLLRHTPRAEREVINGTWRQHVGRQLSQRTVGIIGCGYVGKDLAVLLRAFGCRVLAHDILDFSDFYTEHAIEPVGLEDLLQQSDVVTLHLPIDNSTRNILSAERLALMKPDAIVINAARGGLLDEDALKAALTEGRLGGAALDVFVMEPPEDQELLELPNFIVTPHLGGSAEEAILAMGRAAIQGLDDNQVPEKGIFPKGY